MRVEVGVLNAAPISVAETETTSGFGGVESEDG